MREETGSGTVAQKYLQRLAGGEQNAFISCYKNKIKKIYFLGIVLSG